MQADFILDYDVLPLDKTHRVYLMARFTSGPAPQSNQRRPLNLSLVIDRSGSMGGRKIDYTRQAAQFLVQNLGIEDTLSIVLYNDQIDILLMPEKVRRKDAINHRISGIKPKGTTNLSGGWLEGCNLVATNLDDSQVNRVILMSDGLANRGVTDMQQLIQMAQQKFQENISTTTMGLGTDFNEDLLMEMANAGGGAYYFIESPEVAPLIFQEELQGLLNVCGQNLTVTFSAMDSVRVIGQLNAYPISRDGGDMTFRLGDIYGEEVKAIVLELEIAPHSEAGVEQIASLRFEYDELLPEGIRHKVVDIPVKLHFQAAAGDKLAQPNADVAQSVLLLQAAQARRQAVLAADKGEYKAAAESLRAASAAIQSSNLQDERLREEQAALEQQAREIEQGQAGYSIYDRKTMSTQAFYTMNNRHEDTMMLRIRELERERQRKDSDAHSDQAKSKAKSALTVPRKSDTDATGIKIERIDGTVPTHMTWNEQTFTLEGDMIRIGRSQHNEIVILASGVSRFHCQIRQANGQLLLEDLGSTNGTMVDGNLLEKPHALSVGDVVYLCDEKLIFHDGSYTS